MLLGNPDDPGQTSGQTGQEASLVLTLLIQTPDEETLRRLLNTYPYRELAEQADCHFLVIEDGRVTDYPMGGGDQG